MTLSLLVLAPLLAAERAQAQGARPQPVLSESVAAFVHVAVIPMDRERVLRDQTVVVRGDRIVALGPSARVRVPADAARIDGRGKFLLPGLADMHVHLAFGSDSASDPDIADALFAYLANGITTIRDMHSGTPAPKREWQQVSDAWRLALRRRLATGELLGPRLYTAGDPDYTSPDAASRSVAALKAGGHDFVKISFYQGRWPAMQPVYDSIVTTAHRVGLRVVGHVPPGLPVPDVLAARWASTEHLYEYVEYLLGLSGRWSFTDGGISANLKPAYADTAFWMRPGYRLDQAKLRSLAEATRRAGVWNCPTLYMNEDVYNSMTAYIAEHGGPQSEMLRSVAPNVLGRFNEFHRQTVRALQEAGAGLLLGTDVGGNWQAPIGFTVHHELAALVRAGLTPYQALATGTRNVAAFLGTLDSTGTVEVGKRADLVLLSGNPLREIGYTAGPAGVMVGGRWLARAELEARLAALGPAIQHARQQTWHH